MIIKRLIQTTSLTALALLILAGNAGATNISYNTDQPDSGFFNFSPSFSAFGPTDPNSISLTSGNVTATLTYNQNPGISTGASNINFGNFELTCPECSLSNAETLQGLVFPSFSVDIEVQDVTDGAVGQFIGTSTGGQVYLDESQISVSWAPLQLGPASNDATSGSFGGTIFTIQTPTLVVAPDSGGQTPGETTISGTLTISSVPEPATFVMFGCGLMALGLFGRKKLSRPESSRMSA